jgi:hypothetical protein
MPSGLGIYIRTSGILEILKAAYELLIGKSFRHSEQHIFLSEIMHGCHGAHSNSFVRMIWISDGFPLVRSVGNYPKQGDLLCKKQLSQKLRSFMIRVPCVSAT